jgi:SSS family solute:Na+ symporter
LGRPDETYPWLLHFLPAGLKGWHLLLGCCIVSSLASMLNSTSTIFTMDIYKHINKNADDKTT